MVNVEWLIERSEDPVPKAFGIGMVNEVFVLYKTGAV